MAGSGTRRRLLLVSTNYAPEHAGIGPYATQIAEHWAGVGDEVHVLTGMPHYRPGGSTPPTPGCGVRTEERGGVRCTAGATRVPPRQTAVRRALFEASMLAHGVRAAPVAAGRGRRADAQPGRGIAAPGWRRPYRCPTSPWCRT